MNLFFRTDASVAIGTGHVMRCLALAQAWQDAGGHALFAMAQKTPAIEARLGAESCDVLPIACEAGTGDDASQTIALAREHQAEWIVVDGYQFAEDYQAALKAAGLKIVFLDDYGHARHYSADLLLNQNAGASESLYRNREPQTRLLLGPGYCLLRREFATWRKWKREISPVCRSLLVMMGGSDSENLTARVIEALALARFENVETTVVVGGSNPHRATLEKSAARSGLKITMRNNVSNVAELMAAADVGISAAGSTCWELCLLGLPALVIDVAANQTAVAKELDDGGCAIHVGNQKVGAERIAEELRRVLGSQELRRSLAQKSRELVDGDGARRVVATLRGTDPGGSTGTGGGLRFRRARAEDNRLLWEWANDAKVRASSFSPEPIPWESHVQWLARKLSHDQTLMLIAEEDGVPCGQIRFDARPDGDWEVDLSVAKAMRGRGLGARLIEFGVRALLREHCNARVHAFVKPANAASARAFEDVGFERVGEEEIRGNRAIHFLRQETAPV